MTSHKNKSKHKHGRDDGHKHDHRNKKTPHGNVHRDAPRKGVHKDWRAWVVVLLMLGAMIAYVMSLDESFRPFGGPQEPVRAIEPGEGE